MPSFKSGGLDIQFDDRGDGEAILLIHGFASNAQVNWHETGWVKLLVDEGFRVIAIDNRGHGRSSAPYEASQYSMPIMMEDARGLLDHLSIPQASVMGYSMGAAIATWLAIHHSDRVKRLILGGLAYNVIHGVGGKEELARALEADQMPADASTSAFAYRNFAEQTKSDRRALAACMRGIKQGIPEEEIKGISCPVLIVSGERDEVAGSVKALVDLLPRGEGLVIPGRNHMNTVGDKAYKAAVVRFLKG